MKFRSPKRLAPKEGDDVLYSLSETRGVKDQQNAIDKAKGIICNPMPKTWHDRHAVGEIEDETTRDFYRSIIADKKPYFMRYIYPALMKQYNTYIKNTAKKALREFKISIDDLLLIKEENLSKEQKVFLYYYKKAFPVGTSDCVMNRICKKIEKVFDGYISKAENADSFNLELLKSNHEYTSSQFNMIRDTYNEYNKTLKSYAIFAGYERIDKDDFAFNISAMKSEYRKECDTICSDRDALCDILIDLCYSSNISKRFVWDICGEDIIRNLLRKKSGNISFPVIDEENGNIEYAGDKFSIKNIKIGDDI